MKTQFNVALPDKIVLSVKRECLKLGVGLDTYTEEALRYFRTIRIDDMRARFRGRHKTSGRKLSLLQQREAL